MFKKGKIKSIASLLIVACMFSNAIQAFAFDEQSEAEILGYEVEYSRKTPTFYGDYLNAGDFDIKVYTSNNAEDVLTCGSYVLSEEKWKEYKSVKKLKNEYEISSDKDVNHVLIPKNDDNRFTLYAISYDSRKPSKDIDVDYIKVNDMYVYYKAVEVSLGEETKSEINEAVVDGITWKYSLDENDNAVNVYTENNTISSIISKKTADNYKLYLNIPEYIKGHKVKSIGSGEKDHPFIKTNEKFDDISFPSSLDTINDYAFYETSAPSNLVIPSTVNNIGNFVFYNAKDITSLSFDCDDGISIGKAAFYGCSSLETAYLKGNIDIASGAFSGNDSLKKISLIGNINVGDNAFSNNKNITFVDINMLSGSFGESSFEGCENIEKLNIPNNIYVKKHAFKDCTGLKELELNIENINNYTFEGCSNLAKVIFGKNVSNVEYAWGGTNSSESKNIKTDIYINNNNTTFEAYKYGDKYYSSLMGKSNDSLTRSVIFHIDNGLSNECKIESSMEGELLTRASIDFYLNNLNKIITYENTSASAQELITANDKITFLSNANGDNNAHVEETSKRDGIKATYNGYLYADATTLDDNLLSVYPTYSNKTLSNKKIEKGYVYYTGSPNVISGNEITIEPNSDYVNVTIKFNTTFEGDDDHYEGEPDYYETTVSIKVLSPVTKWSDNLTTGKETVRNFYDEKESIERLAENLDKIKNDASTTEEDIKEKLDFITLAKEEYNVLLKQAESLKQSPWTQINGFETQSTEVLDENGEPVMEAYDAKSRLSTSTEIIYYLLEDGTYREATSEEIENNQNLYRHKTEEKLLLFIEADTYDYIPYDGVVRIPDSDGVLATYHPIYEVTDHHNNNEKFLCYVMFDSVHVINIELYKDKDGLTHTHHNDALDKDVDVYQLTGDEIIYEDTVEDYYKYIIDKLNTLQEQIAEAEIWLVEHKEKVDSEITFGVDDTRAAVFNMQKIKTDVKDLISSFATTADKIAIVKNYVYTHNDSSSITTDYVELLLEEITNLYNKAVEIKTGIDDTLALDDLTEEEKNNLEDLNDTLENFVKERTEDVELLKNVLPTFDIKNEDVRENVMDTIVDLGDNSNSPIEENHIAIGEDLPSGYKYLYVSVKDGRYYLNDDARTEVNSNAEVDDNGIYMAAISDSTVKYYVVSYSLNVEDGKSENVIIVLPEKDFLKYKKEKGSGGSSSSSSSSSSKDSTYDNLIAQIASLSSQVATLKADVNSLEKENKSMSSSIKDYNKTSSSMKESLKKMSSSMESMSSSNKSLKESMSSSSSSMAASYKSNSSSMAEENKKLKTELASMSSSMASLSSSLKNAESRNEELENSSSNSEVNVITGNNERNYKTDEEEEEEDETAEVEFINEEPEEDEEDNVLGGEIEEKQLEKFDVDNFENIDTQTQTEQTPANNPSEPDNTDNTDDTTSDVKTKKPMSGLEKFGIFVAIMAVLGNIGFFGYKFFLKDKINKASSVESTAPDISSFEDEDEDEDEEDDDDIEE